MLSVGEYGRLVACGRLPQPRTWGNTIDEQIRYVDYAVEARNPAHAPDTVAERARQAASPAAALVASGSRWPHCGVERGHKVWIDGLRTRPELNGTCGVVTSLCFSTKRVGVSVMGGAIIYVLVDRLTPFADDEFHGVVAGAAYDDRFYDVLRASVLEFVTSAASDEIGVDIDSIVAAMAFIAETASTDEVRLIVSKLVSDGDCYTTVDDQHFLAV